MKFCRPFLRVMLIPFLIYVFAGCNDPRSSGGLPRVKQVDLSRMDPSLFQEEEWYAPYYLAHFAELANSIIDTGANKGFFSIPVWRNERDNKPYNARIMENIMTLAWFYTQDRPWNRYKGDRALKKRLEAALTFWCNIQNAEGKFSEYAPEKWSLAPTAFATKFTGRALDLLNTGPNVDKAVFERAKECLRKALYVCFTDSGFWKQGLTYTNQYSNLWGGALLYLKNWPDSEIEELFTRRFKKSMKGFQSPCGFFYEKGGPDWGYNLGTHHSDLQVAWSFANQPWIRDSLIRQTELWYEWFSCNALKEPDSVYFILNRAIETRQRKGFFVNNEAEDPANARWTPQAEFIPVVSAFCISREEYSRSCSEKYAAMKKRWPQVDSLIFGDFSSYSAYAFLHDNMDRWMPEQSRKETALALLPYLAEKKFTRIWHDSRSRTTYIFIRKPGYYAIFNAGKIITEQNRYGLGVIWTPAFGTVLQSQSGSDRASWGTKMESGKNVYEANDLIIRILIDGKEFEPKEGKSDLDAGELTLEYPLGTNGNKRLVFRDGEIQVSLSHNGKFSEVLPMLLSEKELMSYSVTGIGVAKEQHSFTINLKSATNIGLASVDAGLKKKECSVFQIEATNKLEYLFKFSAND